MSSVNERIKQLLNIIQEHAYISDVETTHGKLLKFVNDGLSSLQVITDFDCTMTRYLTSEGKRNLGSHHILSASSFLTQEYKAEVKRLNNYYSPIETSMTMSSAEKTPYMVEWLTKIHKLITEQNISKNKIKEMAAETEVEMRPGLDELIEKCKGGDIPVLIFSAGLGNIIEQVLILKNLFYPNMHIISNKMGFNEETGICDHFKEPLIHTFNKSEVTINDGPYYATIKNRGSVILQGDSIGDLKMASGIPHDSCLSIGFYNNVDEKHLNTYLESFDIVVIGDGPMDVVNFIIDAIISCHGPQ